MKDPSREAEPRGEEAVKRVEVQSVVFRVEPEVQVEEQVDATDFNAVGMHDDRGIGSRRPRTRL